MEALGLVFDVDYLRRDRHQLHGELTVGRGEQILAAGDFNFSSVRARTERARYLESRTSMKLDWTGMLEELAQRVLAAEREGEPAVSLREIPCPTPDDTLTVEGLPLLARHPVIWFGDGGTAKSYLALYVAGQLAKRGHRVGFFDWELAGDDHRLRLEQLFGDDMPELRYLRCDRPLFQMVDQVRRVVREHHIDFAIFDSVAFACDGPPEAAEVAARYFQALRKLGPIGSLHIAHISKADGADRKPFGSSFWHNGARSTWNVKLAETSPDDRVISIGLYHRKANLGAIRPAVGLEFTFASRRTTIRRVDLADVADLASGLSTHQRIIAALRHGARSRDEIAASLPEVKPATVRVAMHRALKRGQLIELPGGGIGLPDREGK